MLSNRAFETLKNRIICADAIGFMKGLPSESVNCIVTSPPYFGLRDYGTRGQIGLEKTPAEYVAKMVELFREARRVLKSDGTFWLNLGDSYNGSGKGEYHTNPNAMQKTNKGSLLDRRTDVIGLAPKNLLMIPARVAIALQDDGWYLRSEIVWHKVNAMPESVKDRPTKAHEMIYLLTKSPTYWYDWEAIAEPFSEHTLVAYPNGPGGSRTRNGQPRQRSNLSVKAMPNPLGRNKRDVWTVPTKPFSEAHFATFPVGLIEPMILAGCPGGGVVLDMFMGSGTTALVARKLDRIFIGAELNPEYIQIAKRRLYNPMDMFLGLVG